MRRYFLFICAIALALLFEMFNTVKAQSSSEPELPRLFISTSYPATTGAILNVPAGGNLQSALNNARPGDTIVLEAGAVYTGNFTLPAKSGADWIIIRTSNLAGIAPEGVRVSPGQAAAMPKIITPNAAPAIATVARAHNYRLIGLEVAVATGVKINYGLVSMGDGTAAQNSLDLVPRDLVIDRCYIHGNPTGDVARGVALNSASTAVIDSYVSECHGVGFDTQAIGGWNGPGPFKIVNNYLEGATENVMFGGADPKIANLVPSDIEFRHNHCFKPLSWNPLDPSYAGIHWSVKNIFELKNAQRVLIDGNIFENCWVDGQAGVAVLFTPRNQEGTAPWCVVQDVTYTNNILRHSAAAIHLIGHDNNYPSQQAARIKIKNNLFYDIGGSKWGGNGRLFLFIDGPVDIQIDHNTAFQSSNIITADGAVSYGLVYTNNITPNNDYGVIGSGHGTGNDTINYYFPGSYFAKNAIIAGPGWVYPNGNFFPSSASAVGFMDMAGENFRLATISPYKNAGTDGQDIGADQDLIEAAIGGQQVLTTNQPPQVNISSSVVSGTAPLEVAFLATASDPDGSIVSYSWDFGDGQSSTLSSLTHIYQSAGNFTARLTVTDDKGSTASASLQITVTNPQLPPGSEIVLYASEAPVKVGNWKLVSDATAAGGAYLYNPDAGAPRITTPLSNPASYFEMTFTAQAGTAYRLWFRGKADSNSTNNDSAWVQFSDSTDSTGSAVYRIATTTATMFNLEDCTGCGISGWGWNDNLFGGMGPLIYFATTGTHTIRVQMREDGLAIDQIVLSPQTYLNASPGAPKNDSTILPKSIGNSSAPTISGMSPNAGPTSGGGSVTISGQGFTACARVTIGGMSVTSLNVMSDTSIVVTTPSHAVGAVDVVVTTTDGQSACLVNGYTYIAPNQPPQVNISSSVVSGTAPLEVAFLASASDPDGSIVSYSWDFGDGQASTLSSLTHLYQSAGNFTARLTVTDDKGASASASILITVSAAAGPVVRVLSPNGGESLMFGSTSNIQWSVTGSGIARQSIQLSLDGGATWKDVTIKLSGTATSYTWQIPNSLTSTARIRVRAWSNRGVVAEDMSDGNFSITSKKK